MSEVIHCRCRKGAFSRVMGVLLPDGRLEMRESGKSSIQAGGTVQLSCSKCGFERELSLDSVSISV